MTLARLDPSESSVRKLHVPAVSGHPSARVRLSLLVLMLCAGCAVRVVSPTPAPAPVAPAEASLSPAASPVEPTAAPAVEPAPAEPVSAVEQPLVSPEEVVAQLAPEPEATEEEGEGETDEEGEADVPSADEGEAPVANAGPVPAGPLYTAELSDEELTQRWKSDPASLGSVSVGFVESGRMVNSVRFPAGEDWLVVSPDKAWATQETVDYLAQAIREVRARHPQAPPLRVNQFSSKDGGYLRPHKSHQNGRDVDLGFYYPTVDPVRERAREKYIDPALNWALIRALVTHTDVQMILVDHRVQKVIYDHALRSGESKAWLDSLFHAGANSIVKHAKRHRDHFHVRFFNPRAQELGRRIAPLLALQPDQNIAMHRVRSGDTLGAIALRYNSSVPALRKANRLRGSLLSIGQVLSVPLRGPCTRCPVPPQLVLPPRRLPPEATEQPSVAQEVSSSS
jgi:LysM repeat protein